MECHIDEIKMRFETYLGIKDVYLMLYKNETLLDTKRLLDEKDELTLRDAKYSAIKLDEIIDSMPSFQDSSFMRSYVPDALEHLKSLIKDNKIIKRINDTEQNFKQFKSLYDIILNK
ncbi:MAG: hypothetical protein WC755_00685 [Candidatus Woesearchaeota archaeon]|jgi:hypothetical protein